MAYYLPSDTGNRDQPLRVTLEDPRQESLQDLRVFWGPDICRLEYLIHLVETGRIKDGRPERSG